MDYCSCMPAIFPSYVFVNLNNTQEYFSAIDADGAMSYVKMGKLAYRVPQTVIDSLNIVVGQGENLAVATDHYLPDEIVFIQNWPLTGLSCEVIKHSGKTKVLVRVYILNRNVIANMSLQMLQNYWSAGIDAKQQQTQRK
ncbi:hypothetical protein DVR12_03580 [Chitinophaga silvatica]|uniref:Uncharacterized protein n=2 Tax=Chitinophaga silvatica TaxID=2282649 RepID=A0A3E1YHP5_9BACT|nr:hypothetical protein DVR12_03580 [Chitinophaga silvatica]